MMLHCEGKLNCGIQTKQNGPSGQSENGVPHQKEGCSARSSPEQSHCCISAKLCAVPPTKHYILSKPLRTGTDSCFSTTDAKNLQK